MSDLPALPNENVQTDNHTPLPLLVAKQWDFPLAYVETEGGFFYSVHDWLKGLTEEDDVRLIWANMKRKNSQVLFLKQQFPYRSSNGKTYKMDFVPDKGLYLIAQYLRTMQDRPVLDQIKTFLAKAGAFVDEIRLDPDQAIEAFIDGHRADGKDDHWIWMRLYGKIRRNLFITALANAVAEVLCRRQYADATNDIYLGLWGRTSAHLKRELEIPKNGSLRDNQPMMGLYYQGIAEEAAAIKLGERQEVTWLDARDIIQTVAKFVGKQAAEMAEFMQMDLATGRPLISAELKKLQKKKGG